MSENTDGNTLKVDSIINPDDPRYPALSEKWSKPVNFSKYDTIKLSGDELELMADQEYTYSIDLLETPALAEFVFETEIPDAGTTVSVLFKPTILPAGNVERKFDDGSVAVIWPKVDVFISLDSSKEIDIVANIGGCVYDGEEQFCCGPVWSNTRFEPKIDFISDWAATIYALIQSIMRDRPTVFVTDSLRRVETNANLTNKKNKRPDKRRKAKVVKVIRVQPDELSEYCAQNKSKHTFTCPNWGVAGHKRYYKSGKEVWIKPYRKGKDRHNPETYVAKDYEISANHD